MKYFLFMVSLATTLLLGSGMAAADIHHGSGPHWKKPSKRVPARHKVKKPKRKPAVAKAVPELSADGSGSAIVLLLGGMTVLARARRREDPAD